MIAFCEKCGKKTDNVICKNKRYKNVYVYCLTCLNKRPAGKADLEFLKACIRTNHICPT